MQEYRVNFRKGFEGYSERYVRSRIEKTCCWKGEGVKFERDRKLFVSDAMFGEICSSIEGNIWNIRFNLLLFILRKLDWKLEKLVSRIRCWRKD